jgi:hypothetical protein
VRRRRRPAHPRRPDDDARRPLRRLPLARRGGRGARRRRPGADTLVADDALEVALELPYGVGTEEDVEHPEGIAFVRDAAGRRALLVVHDSPAEHRKLGPAEIAADLYPLG